MSLLDFLGLAFCLLQVSNGRMTTTEAPERSNNDAPMTTTEAPERSDNDTAVNIRENQAKNNDPHIEDGGFVANVLGPAFQERWKDPVQCTETCQCGVHYEGVDVVRVVGGERSPRGAYPWLVPVLTKGSSRVVGSAVQLTNLHMLTTATVAKIPGIYVRVSDYHVGIDDQRAYDIDINAIAIHEEDVDVAVLTLAQEVNVANINGLETICLPLPDQSFNRKSTKFLGYGRVKSDGAKWSRLPKVIDLRVLPNKRCETFSNFPVNDTFKLCATESGGGGGGPCTGDQGGPLMFKNRKTNRYSVIGLSSPDVGCGDPDIVPLFTKVSAVVPWIHRHSKTGVYCGPCPEGSLIDPPPPIILPPAPPAPPPPAPKPIPNPPFPPKPVIPFPLPFPVIHKPKLPGGARPPH